MGQPLANCSIFPLPHANILKVPFDLSCKSRMNKPHQTSRGYKNKSQVLSLLHCPQGALAFCGIYLLIGTLSAPVSLYFQPCSVQAWILAESHVNISTLVKKKYIFTHTTCSHSLVINNVLSSLTKVTHLSTSLKQAKLQPWPKYSLF